MCQRFLVVADNISIPMYIMCVYVCLSRRVGILQILLLVFKEWENSLDDCALQALLLQIFNEWMTEKLSAFYDVFLAPRCNTTTAYHDDYTS